MRKIAFQKYILVFLITLGIFVVSFHISATLNNKRFSELQKIKENLKIDTLSLEIQFSILEAALCENLDESFLVADLYNMGRKLEHMERNLGSENPEVIGLKKHYSLLQIKHWSLVKKANQQCELNLIPILYFYSDKEKCPDCQRQGFVLSYLREKYDNLRIYSFDYDLDLSALDVLKSMYRLKPDFPIIIVKDEVYYGFKNRQDLEEILKEFILETEVEEEPEADITEQNTPKETEQAR